MKDFRGTGVAMVTPFNSDKSIDFEALTKLTHRLIDGGVDYLVVQGTTGESTTMTTEEKQQVLDCVVQANAKRLPIVWGHGGNNTRGLIEAFDQFDLEGVDAILSASPYYNKPSQQGIVQHYKAFADAAPAPVILYNVPGRTASNMLSTTTLELAKHQNIIAIKEACGDLDQVVQIIKNRPAKFLVLSGDDSLIIPHISLGGDGIISVVANAFPKEFSAIAKFCFHGDYNKARLIHYALVDLIYMMFEEGNPVGVKAVCKYLGLMQNEVRLPLAPISDGLYRRLAEAMDAIKALNVA